MQLQINKLSYDFMLTLEYERVIVFSIGFILFFFILCFVINIFNIRV